MRDGVRVGVVGTSWWADAMYLPAVTKHPLADVRAVVGRRTEHTREFATRWSIPGVYETVDQMLDREQCLVDLLAHLQQIAPIDEDHRAIGEHDRGAGRAGEAGEPGKTLLRRRDVFVLMAVGARNDEAVESASFQFGAQRGQPARARVTFVRVVECLEAGLEHRGNLWGVFVRGNRAGNKVA